MSSTLSKEEILRDAFEAGFSRCEFVNTDSGHNCLEMEPWIKNNLEDIDELIKQESRKEVIDFLHWLISPRKPMTISSGIGCFYLNGNEVTYEEIYDTYLQSKQKQG